MATLMLCVFLLEYAPRLKQSCSWSFYPEYVMTVLISVLTMGKNTQENATEIPAPGRT